MTPTQVARATLRGADRLHKPAEYRRCRENGKRISSRRFFIMSLLTTEGPTRLGIVITRKTGGAVVRNRWKRLVRECFRTEARPLLPAGDHVVVVKRTVNGSPDAEAKAELRALFAKAGR